MVDPIDSNTEDLANDPFVIAVIDGLVSGKRVPFWGEGDMTEDDEPRLVLWMERGKIRMQGRGGVDFGAFGNGDVAWRFMRPLLMEEPNAEE